MSLTHIVISKIRFPFKKTFKKSIPRFVKSEIISNFATHYENDVNGGIAQLVRASDS